MPLSDPNDVPHIDQVHTAEAPRSRRPILVLAAAALMAALAGVGLVLFRPATTGPRPTVDDAPTTAGTSLEWSEPQLLAEMDASSGIDDAQVLSSSDDPVVVYHQPGRPVGGCGAGTQPLHQLVERNLATDASTVLIDELRVGERAVLGPNGHVAVIRTCDADVVVTAVGHIDADGRIDLRRLSDPDRRRASTFNNDAFWNLVWSPDGSLLRAGAIEVTTETATVTWSPDLGSERLVSPLAGLVDGHALVSAPSQRSDGATDFWLIDGDEPLDRFPDRPPLITLPADYPAAQITVGPDGRSLALSFVDRSGEAEHHLITDEQGLVDDPVRAAAIAERTISPDGRWAIDADGDRYQLVDLADGSVDDLPAIPDAPAGTASPLWCCDDDLLFFVSDGDTVKVWRIESGPS